MPRSQTTPGLSTREDDVRLTRETVTAASRVMLPTYVIFFGWVGAAYVFTDHTALLVTPALRYADAVLDLRVWGVLALLIAALTLAGIIAEDRHVTAYALLLGLVCCLVWTGLFICAAVFGGGSPSGGAWPFLGAAACFASYRSVVRRERS